MGYLDLPLALYSLFPFPPVSQPSRDITLLLGPQGPAHFGQLGLEQTHPANGPWGGRALSPLRP